MSDLELCNISGVVPIEEQHNNVNFDCGIEALNVYLRKYAVQNHRNNSSKTYVALSNSPYAPGVAFRLSQSPGVAIPSAPLYLFNIRAQTESQPRELWLQPKCRSRCVR